MFGWLTTELPLYPVSTLSLATDVRTRPVGERPLIELAPDRPPARGRAARGDHAGARDRDRRASSSTMRIDHVRGARGRAAARAPAASLQADPDAFGATYESDAARPDELVGARSAAVRRGRGAAHVRGRRRRGPLARDGARAPRRRVARRRRPERDVGRARGARPRVTREALCDACARVGAEHGFAALNTAVVVGNEPPGGPTSPPASRSSARTRGPATAARCEEQLRRARCVLQAIRSARRAARSSCATIACTRALSAAPSSRPRPRCRARSCRPGASRRSAGRADRAAPPRAPAPAASPAAAPARRAARTAARARTALLSSTPSAPAIAAASSSSDEGSAT